MSRLTTILAAGAMVWLSPAPVRALSWDGLWLNDDQRGARQMEQEDYTAAANTFDDPRWRAAAWYRAGEYRRAAEAWARFDDARAHYNRGNALARAGDFESALTAYETALARDPGHADARHNLQLLRELADEQKQSESGESGAEQEGVSDRDRSGREGETGRQSSGGEPENLQREQSPDSTGSGDGSRPAVQSGARDQPATNEPGDARDDQPAPTPRGDDGEESAAQAAGELGPETGQVEERAAMEQWLRRVPDDPGGLLRRKFLYQYQRRGRGDEETYEPW